MVKRFLGVGKVQVGLAIMLFFILVAILGQPFCTHVLHTSPYQVDYMTLGGTAPRRQTLAGHHQRRTRRPGMDAVRHPKLGGRRSSLRRHRNGPDRRHRDLGRILRRLD